MKRIFTALVLIPIVLLVVFRAPTWLFMLTTGAFMAGAAYEYLRLARRIDGGVNLPGGMTVAIFAGVAMVGFSIEGSCDPCMPVGQLARAISTAIVVACVTLGPLLLLASGVRRADFRSSFVGTSLTILVIPYILLPFASIATLGAMRDRWFFLPWLFFMVWSGDIFAYYVGKNFGKRLLAPKVSPKKTLEGSIASVLGAVVVSIIWCASVEWLQGTALLRGQPLHEGEVGFLYAPPIWVPILMAVFINPLAQIGDWWSPR
jgi:phosphatidate cytidylyltransferase